MRAHTVGLLGRYRPSFELDPRGLETEPDVAAAVSGASSASLFGSEVRTGPTQLFPGLRLPKPESAAVPFKSTVLSSASGSIPPPPPPISVPRLTAAATAVDTGGESKTSDDPLSERLAHALDAPPLLVFLHLDMLKLLLQSGACVCAGSLIAFSRSTHDCYCAWCVCVSPCVLLLSLAVLLSFYSPHFPGAEAVGTYPHPIGSFVASVAPKGPGLAPKPDLSDDPIALDVPVLTQAMARADEALFIKRGVLRRQFLYEVMWAHNRRIVGFSAKPFVRAYVCVVEPCVCGSFLPLTTCVSMFLRRTLTCR